MTTTQNSSKSPPKEVQASVAVLICAKYHKNYFQLMGLHSLLERELTTC